MNPMKDPIEGRYIKRLRQMGPLRRLMIVMELSEIIRDVARAGIRAREGLCDRKAVEKRLWEIIGK